MSVSVVSTQQVTTPHKKSKAHKRKHEDVSQSPAIVRDSQPSPTKKTKQKHDLSSATTNGIAASTLKPTTVNASLPDADSTEQSPFFVRTLSLYLPLSPIAQGSAIAGLCAEHLSPLLLTYYPALQGVILSYSNPRVSESPDDPDSSGPVLAVSIGEYGVSFVWLTADFVVLDPKPGTPIEGWINLQSETHIGLVCWNLFEATIRRERLPSDWTWVPAGERSQSGKGKRKDKLKGGEETDEDAMEVDNQTAVADEPEVEEDDDSERHGYYVDSSGEKVSGALVFRVVELDAEGPAGAKSPGFVNLRGTLLDESEEAAKVVEEHEKWERKHAKRTAKPKKKQQVVMSGAHPEAQGNGDAAADGEGAGEASSKEKKKRKDRKDKDGSSKKKTKEDKVTFNLKS